MLGKLLPDSLNILVVLQERKEVIIKLTSIFFINAKIRKPTQMSGFYFVGLSVLISNFFRELKSLNA